MVAQKRSMRESAHKFAKRCSIIFRAVFSSVVPLYRHRSTCSITPALFLFSYFLFSGAMGNKNNDKFAGTTCTQWPATAALLATEIVGQFCGTTGKLHALNFTRPLVGRF
jgi:hypothetical protein